MMLLVDDDRSRLTGAEMKRRGGVVMTTFFIDGLPWAAEVAVALRSFYKFKHG
ncbi:hypothetical protein Hdeb2414_s0025g00662771 [Helianthus debilis subsp. tardiflorus]